MAAESGRDPLVLVPGSLNSHIAEAYRILGANITFGTTDEPVRSLGVLSASHGEGKTSTAVNLGIIVAQAGYRVVIVDADLRGPSLHRAMAPIRPVDGRDPPAGLSSAVLGSAEVGDIVRSTVFDRLTYVPAGPISSNPGQLIVSPRMREVVDELVQMADYVILDTPSLLAYADGLVIARIVDAVIYVVRAGIQDRAAQQRVHNQLTQARIRVLGVVFNDVVVEDGGGGYDYTPHPPNRADEALPRRSAHSLPGSPISPLRSTGASTRRSDREPLKPGE